MYLLSVGKDRVAVNKRVISLFLVAMTLLSVCETIGVTAQTSGRPSYVLKNGVDLGSVNQTSTSASIGRQVLIRALLDRSSGVYGSEVASLKKDVNNEQAAEVPPVRVIDDPQVTGFVYKDENSDFAYSPSVDIPLAGATVKAALNGSVVATARADASGKYSLAAPAGAKYTLTVALPAGVSSAPPGDPTTVPVES